MKVGSVIWEKSDQCFMVAIREVRDGFIFDDLTASKGLKRLQKELGPINKEYIKNSCLVFDCKILNILIGIEI